MPTYEYQCAACGEHTEKFQKINDEPLLICPVCDKAKLERQLSASSFQLKGTGWYVTDFRDKGKKPPDQSVEPSVGEKPAAVATTEKKATTAELKSSTGTVVKPSTPNPAK